MSDRILTEQTVTDEATGAVDPALDIYRPEHGWDPATGAAIKIPAKKVVKFRVAKAVKDAIVPPKKK